MPQRTTTDEAAIVQLHQEFAEAWSGGDTNALVAFFTDDAVRVGAAGDVQRGRDEIRSAFERLLGGPFAGASVRIEPGTVRFLAADLAVWQGPIEIVPGSDRPALRGHAVDVMKRVGSRWLILETHPKLFPPPSPSASADVAREEAAIRAIEAAYDEAWNSADPVALTASFTEDAIVVKPDGQVAAGRAAFRSNIADFFAGRFAGSRHRSTIHRIQFVAPDVAVVDGEATIDSLPGDAPALTHSYTEVFVRRGQSWAIATIRAYAYLPGAP